MKANELRIGNWYDHNGIPKQATPNTIEEVWESERSWCKPIPLTEEWLLKFGFEYRYAGWFEMRSRFNGDYFEMNFHIITKEIHLLQDSGRKYEVHLCNIKHVHQLQNLYFALTGEELTINEQ